MAGELLVFPREIPDTFKKAVQVVHSKPLSDLTLLQRKMLNAWLKNAAETPRDENGWWELRLTEMTSDINFPSKNRPHLKSSAEKLMRIVFEWDVIASEAKRVKWKASVLFPEVEILSEFVRYKISDALREAVLSPEMYALIDQRVVRKYRRTASVGIYEHCIRFINLGKTATVPWEEFRDIILGLSATMTTYQEYKFFKSKILKPSIEEINAEGAIRVELGEVTIGRKVSGLFFTVKKTPNLINQDEIDEIGLELISKMEKLGVPGSEAKRLNKEYLCKDIASAIEYTNIRRANKKAEKLTNPAAYFRKALSQKWTPLVENDISDVEVKEPKQVKPAKLDINAMFKAHQIAEAEKYFSQLDSEDQSIFVKRYNKQQQLGQLLIKAKLTKASQAAFHQWLLRELWGDTDPSQVVEFAQKILSKSSSTMDLFGSDAS